jgi:predicted  nucleic acid-binding Zn-ribbon protein
VAGEDVVNRAGRAWPDARRARELDAAVKRLTVELIPHEPMDWEIRKRQDEQLKAEMEKLRLRNADLEQMLDDAQDEIGDLKRQLEVASRAVVRLRRKGKK